MPMAKGNGVTPGAVNGMVGSRKTELAKESEFHGNQYITTESRLHADLRTWKSMQMSAAIVSTIPGTTSKAQRQKGLLSSNASFPMPGESPLLTNMPIKMLGTEMPVRSCLPAISSHSLGRVAAGHDIKTKLHAAASHDISGIEITYEDLHDLASLLPGGPIPANLVAAASNIRHLAKSLSLTIICLQPFAQYEGLVSLTEHAAAIEKAKLWFQLVKVLGTNCILIPSTFLPATECTSDFTTIVRDMTELADLGAEENPPICFAYENLCWGTHIDTWEGVHAVVSAVNRWNFGYCLDTFNIAGRVYGDPTSADGKTENAEVAMLESLRRMVECVDREKIFFIQVVDAELVSPPLSREHPWYDSSQPMRMTWSRNARLFAFEEERGGYLPVLDVCKALFEGLGYRGWVSFELFSRTLYETQAEVPEEHAARAERSWKKLVEAFPEILGPGTRDDPTPVETKTMTDVEAKASFVQRWAKLLEKFPQILGEAANDGATAVSGTKTMTDAEGRDSFERSWEQLMEAFPEILGDSAKDGSMAVGKEMMTEAERAGSFERSWGKLLEAFPEILGECTNGEAAAVEDVVTYERPFALFAFTNVPTPLFGTE